jgi:4-hydroxythreonine-4-phosphate dehydrogenase
VNDSRPILAISLGDPGGIGPEVVVKTLAQASIRRRARFRVYGPDSALSHAARLAGVTPFWSIRSNTEAPLPSDVELLDYPMVEAPAPRATAEGGRVSFAMVNDAISDALRPRDDPRRVDAVVTGPISKLAWNLAGHGEFPGHTELLASRCRADRFAMMFVSPRLRVILASAHVPLMEVGRALTSGRVLETIALGDQACRRLGIASPRIAVCGLNPHAGEGGMLGDEEQRHIEPAIATARSRGINAQGAFPGDTIFNAAVRGDFDLVVAMYHDQGLIPVKLLDRDRAVNVTVGLPIIRTSPDHGTAFDIAGKNVADAGSMTAAVELAADFACRL